MVGGSVGYSFSAMALAEAIFPNYWNLHIRPFHVVRIFTDASTHGWDTNMRISMKKLEPDPEQTANFISIAWSSRMF